MAFKFEEEMKLFDADSGVPVFSDVQVRPKSGFKYIYEWTNESCKDDWRSDGYRWKQNGRVSILYGELQCYKIYFKLRVAPDEYTSKFSRIGILNSKYPNRVLVLYEGDDSLVVDMPHGNAKQASKTSRPYHRTKPSLLKEMKSVKGKRPMEAFSELIALAAITDEQRSIVDSPRDIKQVRNAQQRARRDERISNDTIDNLYQLYEETDFVSHLIFIPNLVVICYNKSTMDKFRTLLNREDLPGQSIAYDTTFILGDLHLSVLTFIETEFEESPAIPLCFMIHEQQTESVHDFFFMQLNRLVPELTNKDQQRLVILTGDEPSVQNAVKRNFPDTPCFLTWIHAHQGIKMELRSMGVTDDDTMRQYKQDFFLLLNQKSEKDYINKLVDMVMKWNRDFSLYYRAHVDPTMNSMGAWTLSPYDVSLMTKSQSKAFRQILERFGEWRDTPVDVMVFSLLRISELFDIRIMRSLKQQEGEFTLRQHLFESYNETVMTDVVMISEGIVSQIRQLDSEKEKRPDRWAKFLWNTKQLWEKIGFQDNVHQIFPSSQEQENEGDHERI